MNRNSGFWSVSRFRRRIVRRPYLAIICIFIGLTIVGVILSPFFYQRAGLGEFEGVPTRRIQTHITSMRDRPNGFLNVLARPILFVRVKDRILPANGVTESVYARAREKLPVEVEYRVSPRSRIRVFRVDIRRYEDPKLTGRP